MKAWEYLTTVLKPDIALVQEASHPNHWIISMRYVGRQLEEPVNGDPVSR
jgi:hypothetical protein